MLFLERFPVTVVVPTVMTTATVIVSIPEVTDRTDGCKGKEHLAETVTAMRHGL